MCVLALGAHKMVAKRAALLCSVCLFAPRLDFCLFAQYLPQILSKNHKKIFARPSQQSVGGTVRR